MTWGPTEGFRLRHAKALVEALVKVISREVGAGKTLEAHLSTNFRRAVQLAGEEHSTCDCSIPLLLP